MSELEKQTAGLLSGREPEPHAFPQRIGFNLVPQVGPFMANSPWTEEEAGWTLEAARLFGARGETPVIAGTAVQVPTFYGHGLSVHVQLKTPAPVEQYRAALKTSPALKVLDAPAEKVYPMPMLVASDPSHPRRPPAHLSPGPRVAHPLRRGGQRRPRAGRSTWWRPECGCCSAPRDNLASPRGRACPFGGSRGLFAWGNEGGSPPFQLAPHLLGSPPSMRSLLIALTLCTASAAVAQVHRADGSQ